MVRRYIGMLVILLVSGWSTNGAAQQMDSEEARATLKGIHGVVVMILGPPPQVEQNGVTKDQIQTDVELRLRKAGIPVLSREEFATEPGWPRLQVAVNVFRMSAYVVHVSLVQRVRLYRDPQVDTDAETWSSATLGAVGDISNLRRLRETVADHIDAFINAYLAVNQK